MREFNPAEGGAGDYSQTQIRFHGFQNKVVTTQFLDPREDTHMTSIRSFNTRNTPTTAGGSLFWDVAEKLRTSFNLELLWYMPEPFLLFDFTYSKDFID